MTYGVKPEVVHYKSTYYSLHLALEQQAKIEGADKKAWI